MIAKSLINGVVTVDNTGKTVVLQVYSYCRTFHKPAWQIPINHQSKTEVAYTIDYNYKNKNITAATSYLSILGERIVRAVKPIPSLSFLPFLCFLKKKLFSSMLEDAN